MNSFSQRYSGAWKVWLRNWLYFKKTFLVSVFWIVLEPIFYLTAIGFGLGAFISTINGMTYVEFFFPALLCSTVMMVSFFESTYGCYTKLTHQKTYATIMLSPVGPEEIVIGEVWWAATKGFFGAIGVSFVALFFGLIQGPQILAALPILFLLSFVFASFGMIMTSIAKNYDSFIFSTSGIIVPMSLLSGTYFPLEQLPIGVQYLAYIFPLTHGVAAVRATLSGQFALTDLIHILVLLILVLVLMRISIRRIRLKLLR